MAHAGRGRYNIAMDAQDDAPAILEQAGMRLNAYLRELFVRYTDAPKRLMEALQYSLLAGGKRLRPALVLECWAACTNDPTRPHAALAAAAAMELIHTFSLVHDDLPAMDDDGLRRGRPTNHKVFGEAMAILAGDAMVTMAFEMLARDTGQCAANLVLELAVAAGPEGMIGGQAIDIESERKALDIQQLRQLHRMKTGALLRASCRMGAIAGEASTIALERLTEYGERLGLAFQIVDDLLDVTATPAQLGKATGKDAAKGKNTFPALLGVEESRVEATRQLGMALNVIAPLGKRADRLRILAEFVVDRTL